VWQFFTAIAVTHANILTSVHSTIAPALASLRTERFPTPRPNFAPDASREARVANSHIPFGAQRFAQLGGTYSVHALRKIIQEQNWYRALTRCEHDGFRFYFIALTGLLFTFPLRYWFTIGNIVVFSFGRIVRPDSFKIFVSRST